MSDRVPMTPRGKKMLEEKLKHLKSVERPKNILDIETARAHGDLSENAEYSAAKEKQGQIHAMIQVIEYHLGAAHVIDPATIESDKIVFGATVTLLNLDTDEKVTYTIVGKHEAKIEEGSVSIESPIARALIGKTEGDEARVQTPKGIREFEIIDVKYGE